MQSLIVDTLRFEFDDAWSIAKYDEFVFYRRRFCAIQPGIKAVDLIAISPNGELYLIEAKDYRVHRRQKPSTIHDEVALKVVHTLAAFLPLSCSVGLDDERNFARHALACTSIYVVLHLEQARAGSRISPRRYKAEDIELRLRQLLRKSLNSRPRVTEIAQMRGLAWACS